MPDIPRISKGEPITAKRLNDYGDGVNELKRESIGKAKQIDDPVDTDVQRNAGEEEAEVEAADEFIETSRTTSLVQVFDQDDVNYAEVERIESIIFTNTDGKVLKLTFTGNIP
jgi:hypothetical protein